MPPDRRVPAWEWALAGLGALLVLGVLAETAYEGLATGHGPPALSVTALGIVPQPGGFLVRVRAANRGGSTAADVRVEGELRDGDGPPETGEATFDFVPSGSYRDGGLYFSRDPRRGTLRLRAAGYDQP